MHPFPRRSVAVVAALLVTGAPGVGPRAHAAPRASAASAAAPPAAVDPRPEAVDPQAEAAWQAAVAAAAGDLTAADPTNAARALASPEPARAFAALALEAGGELRYPDAALLSRLETAAEPRVAAAIIFLLGSRPGPAVTAGLADHVAARGAADDEAVRALAQRGDPAGREALLGRASTADPGDPADPLAILTLAHYRGRDVTILLNRLLTDWSAEIRAAASEALRRRGAAGLETAPPIKDVPTGAPIEQIAYKPGSAEAAAAKARLAAADGGGAGGGAGIPDQVLRDLQARPDSPAVRDSIKARLRELDEAEAEGRSAVVRIKSTVPEDLAEAAAGP